MPSDAVRAIATVTGVSDEAEVEVESMVTDVVAGFGRVDILVNNAGIFPAAPRGG